MQKKYRPNHRRSSGKKYVESFQDLPDISLLTETANKTDPEKFLRFDILKIFHKPVTRLKYFNRQALFFAKCDLKLFFGQPATFINPPKQFFGWH